MSYLSKIQYLLAVLRAAHHLHWTAHWQTQGPSFYSDHQLFERLYTGLVDEIDTLAEKIVTLSGPAGIDPIDQIKSMQAMLSIWSARTVSGPADQALQVEMDIQSGIRSALDSLPEGAPVGLRNFLEDLADKHDTHVYLLKQRTAPEARVASRYMRQASPII